ncbi:Guanyl-specific ribonuclease Sa3 precursor [Streptomyces sp. YIM 121038]|uniref:ribonuclease domain-containing protein n=1 Tax=Streptomyces sp. YIM 121038 TaxID=2136401 RepID=UPI0011102209|nr:ribonuclease domain-containing protein [Streptomyces sp. YIM 121038]QCX75233.1 Guanyl-specific ribonuclease Sa3 precursor [Streptomyces sp. YIM 121038]
MIIRSAGRVLGALLVCLAVLVTGCGTQRDSGTERDGGTASTPAPTPAWARGMATVTADRLPAEARRTLRLIDEGGPFPYAKDGTVFGNFEGRLPREPRGYYHEYTVRTPGERGRGARRLVTGREHETYYTDDHYASFKAVLR